MNDFDARRDPDEPAVRSAALLTFVAAAARQEHDAEAVTWERMQHAMRRDAQTRAKRRARGFVAGLTALAAAVAFGFIVGRGRLAERGSPDVAAASDRTMSASETAGRPEHTVASVRSDGFAAGTEVEASAVDVPVLADAAAIAGRGTQAVLDDGAGLVARWSGAAVVYVVAAFAAQTDVASDDVRRSSRSSGIGVESNAVMPDEAERLAVAAEDALARGNRARAISLLEKIVRKYSRSRQARAAMLDVARLRSAAGDRDGAACAYRRFLERHPNDEMRHDVNRRLSALGRSDVECRGIDPTR